MSKSDFLVGAIAVLIVSLIIGIVMFVVSSIVASFVTLEWTSILWTQEGRLIFAVGWILLTLKAAESMFEGEER